MREKTGESRIPQCDPFPAHDSGSLYGAAERKDLSKITVTDIVNRADINRATFYAHYPDVRCDRGNRKRDHCKDAGSTRNLNLQTSFAILPHCCCNSVDTWKKMRSFTVSFMAANGSEMFMKS